MADRVQGDVVVIGSGPAGVTAAARLLDAGLSVTMIEAGKPVGVNGLASPWIDFRQHTVDQWPVLAGDGVADANSDRSLKFSVPWVADLAAASSERLQVHLKDFGGVPFAAVGGLSVAWGAGAALFNDDDLRTWPVSFQDLRTSYHTVSDKVGLSGEWPSWAGPPPGSLAAHPGLHPNAARLLQSHLRKKGGLQTLRPALQAVLSRPHRGRLPCDLGGSCLFSCRRGAVWSAAAEVADLIGNHRFRLIPELRVNHLRKSGEGWVLAASDNSGDVEITCRRVMCAAGAIGSARLVLPLYGDAKMEAGLLSAPAAAFSLVFPWRLGAAWEKRFFGLSQLQFEHELNDDLGDVFGGLFAGEGLPLSSFVSMLPFQPKVTMRVLSELVPATLFGNMFLNGRHSAHRLRLRGDGGVDITGGHASTLHQAVALAASRLRRRFLSLGAILAPLSLPIASPGSDLHFAGTLPMRSQPSAGETSHLGETPGFANLIVVDGSLFPTLPGKSHTLTIMANADRIAEHWGRAWSR